MRLLNVGFGSFATGSNQLLLGQHGERVGARMTTGNHEGEVGMSSQRVPGTAVQRTIAVLGSAVFFVVAPFTLAGGIDAGNKKENEET